MRLLVDDREDDNESGCEHGPHEEADFTPETPLSRLDMALRRTAGKESVFLGDVTVVGDLARVAAGEERPVFGHGGVRGVELSENENERSSKMSGRKRCKRVW